MKTKIILGLVMAFAIIGSVGFADAQTTTKPIDILAVNNLLVGEHLRSDGDLEINGGVYVDEAEGWTGTCYYTPVVRDGIIIDCIGGEKL